MSIEARTASFHRVLHAIESGDFDAVSEHDLATCDNEVANRRWRQWVAGGKQTLPLDDPEESVDCNDDVLVRISTKSGFDNRYRYVIEHHEPLDLKPGDLVYIRRQFPKHSPETRR